MKLYIANCSTQKHIFNYRIPESTTPRRLDISAGSQIQIDGSDYVIDTIIEQHKIYGMQNADQVTGKFSGLIYSVNKPVSGKTIQDCYMERNKQAQEAADEHLKTMAIATDIANENTFRAASIEPKDGGIEIDIEGEPLDKSISKEKVHKRIKVVK